jgi:hypothetical protein
VTGYRAALPDPAGPAENHNSQPGDAQTAGLAEVLGCQSTDLQALIEARYHLLETGETAQASARHTGQERNP